MLAAPNARRPGRWRAPLRRVRDAIFRRLDWLVKGLDRLATPGRPPAAKRGVVMFMPHGLGDMILFTAAYFHFRGHYAGQPITLICSPANHSYATLYLGAERLIVLHSGRFRRNLWYRVKFLRLMARAGAAIVIQPMRNRKHMVEDALVRASGAPERIGTAGSAQFITERERVAGDPWYTKLCPAPPDLTHETTHYAAFAAWVTGRWPVARCTKLPRPPRHAGAPEGDYLLIATEASSPVKAWPFANFMAAAAAIAREGALATVLAGEGGQAIGSQNMPIADLRGRADIQNLARLITHARLVLCNDSGPAHLAAVLGVPAIVVGNGAMPGRYLPYPPDAASEADIAAPVCVLVDPPWACFGCGWRCLYLPAPATPVPCMAEVNVADVVSAARAVLCGRSA